MAALGRLARWLHDRDGPAWSRFAERDAKDDGQRQVLELAKALGMVIEDGARLRFAHQLWQEYFAACSLAQTGQDEPWPDKLRAEPQPIDTTAWQLPSAKACDWDQCAQLAVQIVDDPAPLLDHLIGVNPALAGRALHSRGDDGKVSPALRSAIKHALLARSSDPDQLLPERIEAAEWLGHLGDDLRYEQAQRAGAAPCWLPRQTLPDGLPGWVPVPSGKAKIGYDKAAVTVTIQSDLQLAFAPVTVAEFKCFVEDGGYGTGGSDPPPWWVGAAAQKWWREGLPNEGRRTFWNRQRDLWRADDGRVQPQETAAWLLSYSEKDFADIRCRWLDSGDADFKVALVDECKAVICREPDFWGDLRFTNPLQPVIGLSVFETEAYCRWLSLQVGGRAFRLPTEAEWQVASGCIDRMNWPWSLATDEDPDPYTRMNFFETKARRTTPVAVFPAGRSALGLYDLSGQVFEWMANAWQPAPDATSLQALADPRDVATLRAVRGGSWSNDTDYCLPAFAFWYFPDDRSDLLGFRLLSCPILGS